MVARSKRGFAILGGRGSVRAAVKTGSPGGSPSQNRARSFRNLAVIDRSLRDGRPLGGAMGARLSVLRDACPVADVLAEQIREPRERPEPANKPISSDFFPNLGYDSQRRDSTSRCYSDSRRAEPAVMASPAAASVVQQIGSLFDGSSVAGLSDRQLLERFSAKRDLVGEAAFAALVVRHGPMVLGVCRQLLGDRHDAEDAFQAVFLILAQKARSIRDPELLGNWLYGVAVRTSRCARIRLARRSKNEQAGTIANASSNVAVPDAEQSFLAREQIELLHDEIERLPRAFRLPVVLCYLEGFTVHEAAGRLRCSHGTVRSRMARARDKLKRALVRRGVVFPAAALAAALSTGSASASVSSHLCEKRQAARSRSRPASRPTARRGAALAREVLRSMLSTNVKFVALTFLFAGVAARRWTHHESLGIWPRTKP